MTGDKDRTEKINKLSIGKILQENTQINKKMFNAASKMHEELKKTGFTKHGYRLHPRSIRPIDDVDAESDQRTVHLSTER